MALSTHWTQPHPLLGVQSETAATSTQDMNNQLQSSLASASGEGGKNLKTGSKQTMADDGNTIDDIANELLDEVAAQVDKPDRSR